jgi:hypothetical protein
LAISSFFISVKPLSSLKDRAGADDPIIGQPSQVVRRQFQIAAEHRLVMLAQRRRRIP